jgi:hypothetical protein
MARITKGILGPVNGKVGTVVGSNWRGIDYIRSASGPRKGQATLAQLDQQMRFTLMTGFLQSVKGMVQVGFQKAAQKQTALNAALSYNLKNGITGIYPTIGLQYNMLLLSRGDLPNAENPGAIAGTVGKVNLIWTDNSATGKAKADDIALITVYCPDTLQAVYTLNGPNRSSGQAMLDVSQFSGKNVETWLGFISADGKEIANSLYTGQVAVL